MTHGWHPGGCDNCSRTCRVVALDHADPRIAAVCGPCLDAFAAMGPRSETPVAQDGQHLAKST